MDGAWINEWEDLMEESDMTSGARRPNPVTVAAEAFEVFLRCCYVYDKDRVVTLIASQRDQVYLPVEVERT